MSLSWKVTKWPYNQDTVATSSASFLSKNVPLLVPSSGGKLEINSYPRASLNSIYADVGLVQPAVQCGEADGTCDAMRKEIPWRDTFGIWGLERSRQKYVLDLGEHDLRDRNRKNFALNWAVCKIPTDTVQILLPRWVWEGMYTT